MFVRGVFASGFLAVALVAGACSGTDNVVSPSQAGATNPSGPQGNGQPSLPGPETPPGSASCNAAGARWAIGERASDELLERARVAAGARVARFLFPGQPITLEYLAVRVNLELNADHVVVGVTCG
jgi:hypothetical protein